jgi:hypothetical protein
LQRYVAALGASLQINIMPDANAADSPLGLPPTGFPATADAWQEDALVRDPEGE